VAILFSKDSNLYIGGTFTRAGNIQASLIACWGYGLSVGTGRELGIRNEELEIYPNPNDGLFTINAEGTKIKEVKIYDVIGRSFDRLKITEIGNNRATVDLSDVAKGIYFVEVRTEKGVIRKKVVKE